MEKTVTLSKDEFDRMEKVIKEKKDANVNVRFYCQINESYPSYYPTYTVNNVTWIEGNENEPVSSIAKNESALIKAYLDILKSKELDALCLKIQQLSDELHGIRAKWWYKLFAK